MKKFIFVLLIVLLMISFGSIKTLAISSGQGTVYADKVVGCEDLLLENCNKILGEPDNNFLTFSLTEGMGFQQVTFEFPEKGLGALTLKNLQVSLPYNTLGAMTVSFWGGDFQISCQKDIYFDSNFYGDLKVDHCFLNEEYNRASILFWNPPGGEYAAQVDAVHFTKFKTFIPLIVR